MMSLRGKQTALACQLTKFVNKAEKRTFISTNNGYNQTFPPSYITSGIELALNEDFTQTAFPDLCQGE
jgi:hypothetical protein